MYVNTHTNTRTRAHLLKRDHRGKKVREETKKSLGEKDSRKINLDDLIVIMKRYMMELMVWGSGSDLQ